MDAGSRAPVMTGFSARAVLVDLLMATMDSISVWARAAGNREAGLAWRDAVTDRMLAAGRYVPYEDLVAETAAALHLDLGAGSRLREAWMGIEPWPDIAVLGQLTVPFAFVTNCSSELAEIAVARLRLAPAFTLSAEEAGWYKPRAEIYRLAAGRIGSEPPDIRFVAGAAYDAMGAHVAGMQARLVTRRPMAAALPAEIPVIASIDEALSD